MSVRSAEFTASADQHGFDNLCRVQFNVSDFVFVDELLTLAFPKILNLNWHKGPNIAGTDPETGRLVRLFNPQLERVC